MQLFDLNSTLYEILAVPAAVSVVLAILTMRSISLRDRAMTVGRAELEAEAKRSAYERRWRSGGMRNA